MQKIIKTLFFTLLLVSTASAQQIYLCLGGRITTMDAVTFDTATLCVLKPYLEFNDIAIDRNGNLYGCANTKLYRVDITTGQSTEVYDFVNVYNVGLLADASGKLYLAGNNLFVFDPAQSVMQDLGSLPYPCAGDLTFWNGDMYISTTYAQLLKINLQNPAQSTIYMAIPEASVGLATIWDCTTGATRSFGVGSGNVLDIDFEHKIVGLATTKKISAAGATSPWEWQSALANHRSIDTIYYHAPDCSGANGGFELVPTSDQLGMLEFSLDGLTWQTSGLFENLSAGVYTVQIRGGSCLQTTTRLVLNEQTAPPIVANTITSALCGRATGVVKVQPGDADLLYSVDGSAPQTDSVLTGISPGWHVISASAPWGCLSLASVYVPDSTTSFSLYTMAELEYAGRCKGYPITITTGGPTDATYQWTENGNPLPNTSSPSLTLVNTHTPGNYVYGITVTDHNGCSQQVVTDTVVVLDCTHLPNAFTPNGDGANDKFGFLGSEDGRQYSITIYDRWGRQLFHSDDIQSKWDGTTQGQAAPSDVYVFVARITKQDGTVQQWSGDVTLLR